MGSESGKSSFVGIVCMILIWRFLLLVWGRSTLV